MSRNMSETFEDQGFTTDERTIFLGYFFRTSEVRGSAQECTDLLSPLTANGTGFLSMIIPGGSGHQECE